ncbi:putative ABC transporter ATP-binding protein YbhF [compost metagenome]
MPAIVVKGLTKHFEYYEKEAGLRSSLHNLLFRKKLVRRSVEDVSFEIEEGEVVGFLGPNGAGKTTTLKMLSGILVPTAGTAQVNGFIPWERKKAFKLNFSIVMGQKSQLWWDLPASESLLLNKKIYELDDAQYRSTLNELSELLQVKPLLNVQVRRLSLGERMKIELIAALIHKPRIMFLDEPTIGLDLISQKNIRSFIKTYSKQSKTTIILTSHYMTDIEDLCKRSIIINRGSLVYDGDLSRLNMQVGERKRIRVQFEHEIEREELNRYGHVVESEPGRAVLEVPKQSVRESLQAMLGRLPVLDFNIEDLPVEDSLAELYGKGGEVHEAGGQVC